MADIVAVGSAVLDRVYGLSNLPEPDGGAFVREHTERAGGVAANVACALAELDHDAAVVSRVGRDDAGDTVVASLADWGVDASGVHRGDDDTSYALVLRGPDGDRMIVAGGDSVPGLELTGTDRAALRDADCVFTSAYAPDRVVRELVDLRDAGDIAALVFDLAGPLSELEGRGTAPETIDAAVETADLSSPARSLPTRTSATTPKRRLESSPAGALTGPRSPPVPPVRTSRPATSRSTFPRATWTSPTRLARATRSRPPSCTPGYSGARIR